MTDRHWDVIIVGSGFGGSVTAYRMAQAGLRVCLLERGRAYPPNSFPRSPVATRNNFWDPSKGLYGLFNIWSFRHSAAVVSSGLGGGSLIYANVLRRKDAEWFEGWPITRTDLDPHYQRVERMMNVQRYPIGAPPFDQTKKNLEMRRAAEQLGRQTIALNLAVSFRTKPISDPDAPDSAINPPVVGEPIWEEHRNLHKMTRYTCRLCGECDLGCNYGSKNTLDFNYLSEAKRLGVCIRTLSEVETFRLREDGNGYEVSYLAHDRNNYGRELSKRQKRNLERTTATCDRLILAAGTMGTTFLLMKNREAFPNLSRKLGHSYSINGDDLAFFVDAKRELSPDFGPVITTAIRYPDSLDGQGEVGRGFYVEDGGNPYLLSWMVELSGVPGLIRRAARFVWIRLRYMLRLSRTTEIGYAFANLIGSCRRSSRAMPVLVMGRDVPSGVFTMKDGILDCDWTIKPSQKYYDRTTKELKKIAKAMEAKYEANPNFRWNFQQSLTAHPLGGCPMGVDPEQGVVNPWGEVFGYPGLYVADGSAMPGPVGTNPSLTIAAFADRVADGILADANRTARRDKQVPAERQKGGSMPVKVEFAEVMKGRAGVGESTFEGGEQGGQPLQIDVKIRTENIEVFLADPDHKATVEGYVRFEALGDQNLPIQEGEFDCLVDTAGNTREMRYRLFFDDCNGRPHTLSGVKKIRHDGIQNTWRDTSTLFTKLFAARVTAEQEPNSQAEANGIIRIEPLDFLHELTTIRGAGGSLLERLEAVERFTKFFIGELWDVYRPRQGSMSSHGGKRGIPLFTLEGVEEADISTHYFSTPDKMGLHLFQFKRKDSHCDDVVVLLHGLTTSTDMFVMPEHKNIVNYLFEKGFTDVWSFDWRGSMRYSYDLFPAKFTLDDVALYDMPAAFSKIRQIVGPEKRIHVICHCVGSMTFMMSLYAKLIHGITSVISNSVSLTPRIAPWSRFKLFAAPKVFFRATNLNPRWRYSPGLFPYGKWLAKGVSLFHRECGVAACHLVSFMWGAGHPAAWLHENLHEVTHERTGDLFGAVNIDYYRHIRKMAAKQLAVKLYPNDRRYDLLPNNYLQHAAEIDTPILFVTGEENRVFRDSNVQTFKMLNELKPGNKNELKVFAGYGHQDVFMGKNNDQDTFPTLLAFLEKHSKRGSLKSAATV